MNRSLTECYKGLLILDVKDIVMYLSKSQILDWYRRENRPRSENVIQYKLNCFKKYIYKYIYIYINI